MRIRKENVQEKILPKGAREEIRRVEMGNRLGPISLCSIRL